MLFVLMAPVCPVVGLDVSVTTTADLSAAVFPVAAARQHSKQCPQFCGRCGPRSCSGRFVKLSWLSKKAGFGAVALNQGEARHGHRGNEDDNENLDDGGSTELNGDAGASVRAGIKNVSRGTVWPLPLGVAEALANGLLPVVAAGEASGGSGAVGAHALALVADEALA